MISAGDIKCIVESALAEADPCHSVHDGSPETIASLAPLHTANQTQRLLSSWWIASSRAPTRTAHRPALDRLRPIVAVGLVRVRSASCCS